jgi:hypothetical protein
MKLPRCPDTVLGNPGERAVAIFAPPIQEYDGRLDLQSIADALAKLRELDGLADDDKIEIKTARLTLAEGHSSGFVVVLGPLHADGSRRAIRMPSSARFMASTTLRERQAYDIAVLNDAVGDAEGNVELSDGRFLHLVDLIPTPFAREWSDDEEAIVEHALKFLEVDDRCYSPIHDALPPDVQMLRYDAVAKIRIRRLKPVQHYVWRQMPHVSASLIAATLRRAGMQLPRSQRD